ncbi:MAG: aspartate kinase [Nitriliruptoraceae bacterium]
MSAAAPVVVQKYGGTSVGDVERLQRVARRIAETHRAGNRVLAVVSAMGDTTDDLVGMAAAVNPRPPQRELDILLTSGERIAMSLLAMAVEALGVPARSFTGSQAGIITDAVHGKARIVDVTPQRVREALDEGRVVIVAGCQGVSRDPKDITTRGRGGSDTTAVAMAAAIDAAVCELCTDVDGVYTADPRLVPDARKLARLSFEEMLELAAQGAKVLQVRSVEFGRNHGVRIHVRSSFNGSEGTWIVPREDMVEDAIISGVAHDTSEAKVTVVGVPDRPGVAAGLFSALAAANINVDMIVQNVSSDGRTDISFTVPRGEVDEARELLAPRLGEIGAEDLVVDPAVAKVSLVGAGMKTHPGVAARMFSALSAAGVNIQMISTSTIRVSVVVADADVTTAVRAVHTAFELAADAVVAEQGAG